MDSSSRWTEAESWDASNESGPFSAFLQDLREGSEGTSMPLPGNLDIASEGDALLLPVIHWFWSRSSISCPPAPSDPLDLVLVE